MTDYIKREDASELFDMLLEHYHDTGVEVIKHTAAIAPKEFHVSEADDMEDFNSEINGWKNSFSAIPSADVAPVRHGRWEAFEDMVLDTCYRCSECGREFYLADCGTPQENEYNYCPNCGAFMDKEE